jgi:hypothetical protein
MGFLQGVAQTLDLQPAAEAFNTARRRREDRKERVEDQDRTELLGWQKDAAKAGVSMPERGPDEDPYTSGDYRGALGDFNSPAAINARKQAEEVAKSGLTEEAWKKAQQDKNRLEGQQREEDAEKFEEGYVPDEVKEARRIAWKKAQQKKIDAARGIGMDITNGRGQVDPKKYDEFLAEKRKQVKLQNAERKARANGVSPVEIAQRISFIKDEIPNYMRELDFYSQAADSDEGLVSGKSIPKMDALRASIKRMEDGDPAEKISKIRDDMTKLREYMQEDKVYKQWKQSEGERAQNEEDEEAALKQERVKDWRGDDSQSIDWLGGERPKTSAGPLTPGQSPLRPSHMPSAEEVAASAQTPDAAATPPPEEAPTTTPLPEAGAQDPATTATLPDTVAPAPKTVTPAPETGTTTTTPTPGAVKPADTFADPFAQSTIDEEKAARVGEETLGREQRDVAAKKETPEQLQLRYADTDLSIQERYYNPGSLMLKAVEDGHGFGWKGLVGIDTSGYAQFDSPKAGMDALKQQLRVDRGRTKKDGSPFTVGDFVKKYVGEDADPDGTKRALKNYPKLLGKNAPNGLDTHIKDIEFQALLKAVMTNENHSADSLGVFQHYMEDTPLDPGTQTPGVNPIMEGTGGLGEQGEPVRLNWKLVDDAALIEALAPEKGEPELDWDTLSPEDKAWIQKNRPNIYNAIKEN